MHICHSRVSALHLCTFATAVFLHCIRAPLPQLCACIAFVHIFHSRVFASHTCGVNTHRLYAHRRYSNLCMDGVFCVFELHMLAPVGIFRVVGLYMHSRDVPPFCTHVPCMLSTDAPTILHTCSIHAFNRCSPLSAHVFHACFQHMFPLSAHVLHACFQQMFPQSCTHVSCMLSTDVPPFLHTFLMHAFNTCPPLSAHISNACFQQMFPHSCTHISRMLSTHVPTFLHTFLMHAFNRCSPFLHICFMHATSVLESRLCTYHLSPQFQ